MLPIQDEIIPLRSQKNSRRFAQQYKCETISILGLTIEEEFIRIDSILDRAADQRKDVKYDWRAVTVREPELLDDVGDCCDNDDEKSCYRD